MELSINLGGLHPDVARGVIRGLQHEDKARHDLGVLEQLRLKKLMDAVAEPGFNTDIGPAIMVLSPEQAAAARRIYGDRCFADPDFGKFLLRQNPEFRVKDVGTRVQSGWTGRREHRTSNIERRTSNGGKRRA